MFPQSCSMVEEGSNMKIPMFHKTAIKSKCRADKSDGYSKKTVPSKSVDHKIGSVCEIENAIGTASFIFKSIILRKNYFHLHLLQPIIF